MAIRTIPFTIDKSDGTGLVTTGQPTATIQYGDGAAQALAVTKRGDGWSVEYDDAQDALVIVSAAGATTFGISLLAVPQQVDAIKERTDRIPDQPASAEDLLATSHVNHLPASNLALIHGTVQQNTSAAVTAKDGIAWVLGEHGVNGLTVGFEATVAEDDRPGYISVVGHYTGTPAASHYIQAWAYNVSLNVWEKLKEVFMPANGLPGTVHTAPYSERHIDRATGKVQVQLRHAPATFHSSHWLHLDFVELTSFEIATAPREEEVAAAVRAELTAELGRIDVAVSTRHEADKRIPANLTHIEGIALATGNAVLRLKQLLMRNTDNTGAALEVVNTHTANSTPALFVDVTNSNATAAAISGGAVNGVGLRVSGGLLTGDDIHLTRSRTNLFSVLTSSLTQAGSLGKLLVDMLNATVGSRLAAANYVVPDNEAIAVAASKAHTIEQRLTSTRAGLLDNLAKLDLPVSEVGMGAGSKVFAYTVTTDSGFPVSGARVIVSTDEQGVNRIRAAFTNDFGVAHFNLDPGTYYFWTSKAGIVFNNPDVEVVV